MTKRARPVRFESRPHHPVAHVALGQVTAAAPLALLAEGFEFLPIWRAKIPDLVRHAGGATNEIGNSTCRNLGNLGNPRARQASRLADH
jgi:hypothetical protein